MTFRNLPNFISALRLISVVPILWLLIIGAFDWALVLFAMAGLSDGIDGFLARHYGWHSKLGGILDPLADKVLLVASFLALGALGLLPLWLVLIAVIRDLVILGGAMLYRQRVGDLEIAPLFISKLNTFVQILLVFVVIAAAGSITLFNKIIEILIWMCFFTLIASGISYVWIWSYKAIKLNKF